MRFNRRQLVVAGLSAAVLSAGGFGLYTAPARAARKALAASFGDDVANHPETTRFLDSYLIRYRAAARTTSRLTRLGNQARTWGLPLYDAAQFGGDVVQTYLTSTNVVLVAENGEDLAFVALRDPYASPCTNQLSANWL